MKKYILLKVDADSFKVLKSIKLALWREDKKFLKWEDFLVDWVIHIFKLWQDKNVEKAVEEISKGLRPECRKAFKNYVDSFLAMKLLYFRYLIMEMEENTPSTSLK